MVVEGSEPSNNHEIILGRLTLIVSLMGLRSLENGQLLLVGKFISCANHTGRHGIMDGVPDGVGHGLGVQGPRNVASLEPLLIPFRLIVANSGGNPSPAGGSHGIVTTLHDGVVTNGFVRAVRGGHF